MDINFNKSTNITWKPDNTLEVASSNGHVSKITGVSFANYLLVKDNPKLLKLIEKRAVSLNVLIILLQKRTYKIV